MIGYYVNSGDQEGSNMFSPYIWNENGIDTLMKKKLPNSYGNDLTLLLIQYYVEGKFSSYLPLIPKIGNYIKKTKDIAVAIAVTRVQFHNKNEFERREFIVDSTLNAVKLVKDKFKKKQLNVDFDRLTQDIKELAQEYLKHPEPYSKI